MTTNRLLTLDLNFLGRTHAIAVYLLRHADGVVLIDGGPGSTLSALEAGLAKEQLTPKDVTHVLLTHIHLDHAGAAGWWARQGAEICVHPLGAPHLLNPEKLIASARRIYGDRMETLWGEFLPVPEKQLRVVADSEELAIGNLKFAALHTPGHAEHHCSYLWEGTLFCGDVGGVRVPGYDYVQVPMPPPELHIERWRESIARMRSLKPGQLAPTHFGIFHDPEWQFDQVDHGLESARRWLDQVMPADAPIEQLRQTFTEWVRAEAGKMGINEEASKVYELANPPSMSADGLLRYWKKTRGSGSV